MVLNLKADDILPRAAPLNCVADISDTGLAALIDTIGPWMPNLRTVENVSQLAATVKEHRPDIVMLGQTTNAEALETLRQHVPTEKIGVAMFQPAEDVFSRFAKWRNVSSPYLEIEAIELVAGVTEVVLRLRSLLRRCRPLGLSQRRTIGEITLDEASLTLTINEASAPIGLDGFRLIGPMFDLPDHVWRQEELHTIAYGSLAQTNVDVVRVNLSRTRRKLVAKLGRDPVRTVHGTGYRLVFVP